MPTQDDQACHETETAAIQQCVNSAEGSVGFGTITRTAAQARESIRREPINGVSLGDLDPLRIAAELHRESDGAHPWYWHGGADNRDGGEIHGRENRQALLTAWADREDRLQAASARAIHEASDAKLQIRGTIPTLDSSGNAMPSTTAEQRKALWLRRQWLYNNRLCHMRRGVLALARIRSLMAAMTPHALSANLATAKQQLLARYDRAVTARCLYLFDGHAQPHNEQQRAARDAMMQGRQNLVRALRKVTSIATGETVTNSEIAVTNATAVAGSPAWDDNGDPLSGFPALAHSSTYTRGRGKSKWKVALHAFTATNSDEASKSAGDVLLDDFAHPEFEVVNVRNRASDGDLNFDVRRKTGASGHPAAGVYVLQLTARNLRGPSTITLTVTVPEMG